ncbi:MAG: hypothetical protein GVY14_03680 [Spirochaetes bacterium]|jgi:hypothetical protein|nr:hypothetical protein [Spirochaetota bacterium]
MSSAIARKIGERVREAGAQAAWRQWARLGATALQGEDGGARAIVDPEALLLLSLYLEPAERRLRDFTCWWAHVGSELMSVQRTKTLLKRFPAETEGRLGAFARWAMENGDKRWRRYAPEEPEAEEPEAEEPEADGERGVGSRSGKGADRPRLSAPPALVLRLRAGFGVSAKADVMAYLLGTRERAASVQETADATAYSRATVGGALSDMARAGFIQEIGDRTARYFAPVRPWAQLLQFESGSAGTDRSPVTPAWRYWSGLFAFLAQTDRWARSADDLSDYLRSSRARDIYIRYQPALDRNRIDAPRPEAYRGATYLEGFEETVDVLVRWLPGHL